MIRRCTEGDVATIEAIINDAAEAYRGVIPADCFHEPYMARTDLESEIAAGVEFWGWEEGGELVGVMGIQGVRDVTLIRHAYVRRAHQGEGIGGRLLGFLEEQTRGPLLIGTWAAAEWAIRFYQRHGFRLLSLAEKNELLPRYWRIPERQKEVSVVLAR
ncbi:MAG TPA: GNAT family N-acetyltransferase [Bryobacteraceae bacterium]|nr:GNAT family N-acetyltransferase [Bryobacteraceae bacterium]